MIGYLFCELIVVYLFNIWYIFKDKNFVEGIKFGYDWV